MQTPSEAVNKYYRKRASKILGGKLDMTNIDLICFKTQKNAPNSSHFQ